MTSGIADSASRNMVFSSSQQKAWGTQPVQRFDDLVLAAQQGDLDAFETLVQRFQGLAYSWARAVLFTQPYLAEDAVQEAFIEAYLTLSQLREPGAFPGWLRRIIIKHGDRLLRGKQLSIVSLAAREEDIPVEDLNPAAICEVWERRDFVRAAIANLPEHERVVTLLFYGTGYAIKDISAFLELPQTTIKKRLVDARRHLKGRLQQVVREKMDEQPVHGDVYFSRQVRLLIAARSGDYATVQAILTLSPHLASMPIGTYTAQGSVFAGQTSSALHEAAAYGHVELVKLLVEYGASVNAITHMGLTPLHEAVAGNHVAVVRLLLTAHALPNVGGITPLHWAVQKGYVEVAALLLAAHASVDVPAPCARTPLHWAALKGYSELVALLLQYGASPQARDELGRNALDWAQLRKHDECVRLLLRWYEQG